MTMIEFMKNFLSDTYALAVKTHAFHWNVTGQNFRSLHLLFDEQYKELLESADVIAERIRALGYQAPGGIKTYAQTSSIDDPNLRLDAEGMVAALAADHTKLGDDAKKGISIAAQAGDDATADILIARMREHEKQSWMLNSILDRAAQKGEVSDKLVHARRRT